MRSYRLPKCHLAARLRAALAAGASAAAALLAIAASVAAAGHSLPASAAGAGIHPDIVYARDWPTTRPHGGYVPAQIRAAYDVAPLQRAGIDGRGQSIVIVDSYGSPAIAHDLGVFDRTFGLPAPPSLRIIAPVGAMPRYEPGNPLVTGWASETTLDVEWAHVIAPAARIVLVEVPVSENEGTTGFPQIRAAELYAVSHHLGGVINQSFGATEQTFGTAAQLSGLRGAYIEAARPRYNITVLAAAGDNGASDSQANMNLLYTYPVADWPASDPLVTGVGGTSLRLTARGARLAPDMVWKDPGGLAGGGGRSEYFALPSYQSGQLDLLGNERGEPDISLSGSCTHPVDVYQSFPGQPVGWYTACGTSEATPLFSGVVALADQLAGHPLGPINRYLYRMAASRARGIVDVVAGDNSVSFHQQHQKCTVFGWTARPGYDLASGVGTVDAAQFVPELVALAGSARSLGAAKVLRIASGSLRPGGDWPATCGAASVGATARPGLPHILTRPETSPGHWLGGSDPWD